MSVSENIKIAVRVRPFIRKLPLESDPDLQCTIEMPPEKPNKVMIWDPAMSRDNPAAKKEFTYEYCFWSHDPAQDNYVDQDGVFEELGKKVFQTAWDGYHSTLFAYGQSGSGKTFSMKGDLAVEEQQGIIPRVGRLLIERANEEQASGELHDFRVYVSIVQVYLERVTDLLSTSQSGANEEMAIGIINKLYGWGCPKAERVPVQTFDDIGKSLQLMDSRRVTHGTNLNAESSRGHTILTLFFQRTLPDGHELMSKINLVDLAGSERIGKTGADGLRAEEGRKINLSLLTLGRVIRALGKRQKNNRPPFNDSKLTKLLRESLSKNSVTVMIAALNPSPNNYDETLSTLRFAKNVHEIKITAKRNIQSAKEKEAQIKAQAELIANLQERLAEMENRSNVGSEDYQRRLAELESMRKQQEEDTMSEEARKRAWEAQRKARDSYMETLGLSTPESLDPKMARLVNMSEDSQLNGRIAIALEVGCNKLVGSRQRSDAEGGGAAGVSDPYADVVLEGMDVAPIHCRFRNDGGRVLMKPEYDLAADGEGQNGVECEQRFQTWVNGREAQGEVELQQGDRLWVGRNFVFFLLDPQRPPLDREPQYHQALIELLKNEEGFRSPEEIEEEIRRKQQEWQREVEEQLGKQKEDTQKRLEKQKREIERKHEEEMRRMQESNISKDQVEHLQSDYEKKLKQMEEDRLKLMRDLEDQKERGVQLKEAEARRKAQLDNQLNEVFPMCRRANIMAADLKRDVEFQPLIRQRESANMGLDKGIFSNAEAVVEVLKGWSETSSFLSIEAFKDRFHEMQMVHRDVSRAMQSGEEYHLRLDKDPFYVPSNEELLFGQAFIFLFPLKAGMGTTWINEEGEEEDEPETVSVQSLIGSGDCEEIGEITYSLLVTESEIDTDGDPESDGTMLAVGQPLNFSIVIREVNGLRNSQANDVVLRYRFFNERSKRSSDVVPGNCNSRKLSLHFSQDFSEIVTESLLKYLDDSPLVVELWGKNPELSTPDELKVGGQAPLLRKDTWRIFDPIEQIIPAASIGTKKALQDAFRAEKDKMAQRNREVDELKEKLLEAEEREKKTVRKLMSMMEALRSSLRAQERRESSASTSAAVLSPRPNFPESKACATQ